MKKINPMLCGLATGLLVSGLHLVWALMVFFGWGQMYLDWILSLHFIENPYVVRPFDLATAFTLVVVTAVVGYIIGWVSAVVWNVLFKGKK